MIDGEKSDPPPSEEIGRIVRGQSRRILRLTTTPNILVVHPSIPVKSVKELVALAKSHPGKMSYSSSGNGAPNHLGMELFKQAAKIDIVHIPYKGAAPSRIDFLGGHVHTMFDVLRTALPYHEAGKSRILAVAGWAVMGSSRWGAASAADYVDPLGLLATTPIPLSSKYLA